MFMVAVNRAEVVPLVQFVAGWADWCVESPWELIIYIICFAAFFRVLANNRKVRTAVSVALLFWRVFADMCQFYGKRLLRRLKPQKVEQFTGDPNQPVMRRPMMRPPRGGRPSVIPPLDMESLLKSLPQVQQPDRPVDPAPSTSPASESQQSGVKSCETCEDSRHDKTE